MKFTPYSLFFREHHVCQDGIKGAAHTKPSDITNFYFEHGYKLDFFFIGHEAAYHVLIKIRLDFPDP